MLAALDFGSVLPPVINPGTDLARKLRLWCMPNGADLSIVRNLARTATDTAIGDGTISGMTTVMTPYGLMYSGSLANFASWPTNTFGGKTEFSVLWAGIAPAWPDTSDAICGQHDGTGLAGTYDWLFVYVSASTGNWNFFPIAGSAVATTTAPTIGKFYVAIGTYRSGVTGGTRLYLNGVLANSGTIAGTSGTAEELRLGDQWNSGTSFSHKTRAFGLWDRALTFEEVAALSANLNALEFNPAFRTIGRLGTTAYTLALDTGAYTLTGTAAALKAARTLAIGSGSYAVSGTDVALKVGRKLALDAGAYALTGTDATLTYTPAGTYVLACASGTYTISGAAVTLKATRTLALDTGAYSISGTDAALKAGRKLALDAGTYALTGATADLQAGRKLTLDTGAYTITGTAATLTYSGAAVVLAPDRRTIIPRIQRTHTRH